MAQLVTTLVDARGWLRVDRIGSLLVAEFTEPAAGHVVAPGGPAERFAARRVCLHDAPHLPASGPSRGLDEPAVRGILGRTPGGSLVRQASGDVQRAGLAYRKGNSLRAFVVADASPPGPGSLTSTWGPECGLGTPPAPVSPACADVRLTLLVLLDRPLRGEAYEVLSVILRESRGAANECFGGTPQVGIGVELILAHPTQRTASGRTQDEVAQEQARVLTLAVRDATADALAIAGFRVPAARLTVS